MQPCPCTTTVSSSPHFNHPHVNFYSSFVRAPWQPPSPRHSLSPKAFPYHMGLKENYRGLIPGPLPSQRFPWMLKEKKIMGENRFSKCHNVLSWPTCFKIHSCVATHLTSLLAFCTFLLCQILKNEWGTNLRNPSVLVPRESSWFKQNPEKSSTIPLCI